MESPLLWRLSRENKTAQLSLVIFNYSARRRKRKGNTRLQRWRKSLRDLDSVVTETFLWSGSPGPNLALLCSSTISLRHPLLGDIAMTSSASSPAGELTSTPYPGVRLEILHWFSMQSRQRWYSEMRTWRMSTKLALSDSTVTTN